MSGFTGSWVPFNLKAQVAGVKTQLGSVYHMIKAGNSLVFDSEGSYMMNKATGQRQPITERAGSFEIDLWVQQGQASVEIQNMFGSLESDEVDMDFIRRVEP